MRRTKSGLPKHCGWNADQHGTRRVRFRKGGFSTYLTGIPWSEDFMRQYAAALEGVEARKTMIGADRSPAGSLAWLVAAYLDGSPESVRRSRRWRQATRKQRRHMLDRWRSEHGQLPLFRTDGAGRRHMLLTRQHVQVMVNRRGATPFGQRNFLNTLRALFKWAMEEGRVPDDPTIGVTRPKASTSGYRTWGDEEIARFEGGSRSAARRGWPSACCCSPANGAATSCAWARTWSALATTARNSSSLKRRRGTAITIPMHPKLREIIDATPMIGVKTFLVTHYGKPYTAAGFGNWFRDLADEAGCPGLSAHGLRKATATMLAELGCGDKQIAADPRAAIGLPWSASTPARPIRRRLAR